MEEPMVATEAKPAKFKRELSGFGVIILTLSILSPGVSIFVSGASIMQTAGTGAILGFLLGSLINYCQTSMSAELGAAYPTAGSDSASLGHAIGDWMAASLYISGLFGIPLFLNISAVGIATYLPPSFIPGLSDNAVTLITVGVITFMALLNMRASEMITGVFMLIELGALLLVAGIGAYHTQPGVQAMILHPVIVDHGSWTFLSAAGVGMAMTNASWSIAGSNQALYFCEDMKRPETIGRIIMISFLITAITESAPVLGAILGSHDLKAVLTAKAPFVAFLQQYLSPIAVEIFRLSIAIAIFNACLAGFIGLGRNVFAMGRTKIFHPIVNHALTRLIPQTDAPWVAILLIGLSTAAVTWMPLHYKLLLLAGGFALTTLFYSWGIFAGRRSGRTGTHAYKTPLYPLIPIIGLIIAAGEAYVFWIDNGESRTGMFINLGFFLIGWLYYYFVLRKRSGGWKMTGPEDVDAMVRD